MSPAAARPEEARCAGPLRYHSTPASRRVRSGSNGELTQPVELQCVRCLEKFPFEIVVNDFAVHTDLTGPEEIDLTPFMREDILLNLPAYPHCDREGGRVCPVPEVLKTEDDSGVLEARPPDWSALDKLKFERVGFRYSGFRSSRFT